MSGHPPRSEGAPTRRLVVALVLVPAVVLALGTAPGAATHQQAEDPTVGSVSTTVADGNLTVEVRASNVTEVDVTDVPADWDVVAHTDDDGVYGDRVEEEGVVRWFWTAPFDVNVSVTFALPDERFGTAPTLGVVPYAGTIEGERTAVAPDFPTPTPTETATPTPTATPSPTPAGTPTPTPTGTSPRTASTGSTPTEGATTGGGGEATTGTTTGESTDASGPGFGVVALLAGAALTGLRVAGRRVR